MSAITVYTCNLPAYMHYDEIPGGSFTPCKDCTAHEVATKQERDDLIITLAAIGAIDNRRWWWTYNAKPEQGARIVTRIPAG